jgi:Rod binding domain-containing protein
MHLTMATTPTAGTGTLTTPQPRLVRAAHEFEAQMMKELMGPLNRGSSLTGDDENADQDAGSAGALGEFASEALGRALSEGGGFGIAAGIVKQLSAAGTQNGTVPVIGNPRNDTVLSSAK